MNQVLRRSPNLADEIKRRSRIDRIGRTAIKGKEYLIVVCPTLAKAVKR